VEAGPLRARGAEGLEAGALQRCSRHCSHSDAVLMLRQRACPRLACQWLIKHVARITVCTIMMARPIKDIMMARPIKVRHHDGETYKRHITWYESAGLPCDLSLVLACSDSVVHDTLGFLQLSHHQAEGARKSCMGGAQCGDGVAGGGVVARVAMGRPLVSCPSRLELHCAAAPVRV
jgi:hypothetical protein